MNPKKWGSFHHWLARFFYSKVAKMLIAYYFTITLPFWIKTPFCAFVLNERSCFCLMNAGE